MVYIYIPFTLNCFIKIKYLKLLIQSSIKGDDDNLYNEKVNQDDYTEHNTIPAKHFKIVFFNITH